MISIRNISIQFDKQYIIKDFSLDIQPAERVCLFAPSGRGKTTLLRALCGLQELDSGSIHGLENKRIAVLFQENRLLPQLSAEDNLKLVLPAERRHEVPYWLDLLCLSDAAHKTPLQLSGGMNRRLAIARTLAYGGDLYLLDEPFQGLDEATLKHCLQVVNAATQGKQLLLITHRQEEAEALCNRIVHL